jgi:hypothetical protein
MINLVCARQSQLRQTSLKVTMDWKLISCHFRLSRVHEPSSANQLNNSWAHEPTSSLLSEPGSESCCLNVRIAKTAAS